MENKIYYFDVEIKKREFLSRIYLACKLVDKGSIAFIGPRVTPSIARNLSTSGLVIRKSISPNEQDVITNLKNNGFDSISWDEEGFLVGSLERFSTLRHSEKNVESVKAVFSWGKKQNDFLKEKYSNWENKFFEVGNPRVDLWKHRYFGFYDSLANDIKREYDEFVLIPSNFALYTNKELCKSFLKEAGYLESIEQIEEYNQNFNNVKFLFDEFVNLIKEISANGMNIVVRPHPSDNEKYMAEIFSNIKGVYVKSDNDIAPWILASTAIIHNCCTTSAEAFLMGKKVISYCPNNISQYPLDDINNLAFKAINSEQVLSYLKDDYRFNDDKNFTFDGFLKVIGGIDKAVNILDSLAVEGKLRPKKIGMSDSRYKYIYKSKYLLRNLKDKLILNTNSANNRKTMRAKFPLTYPQEIRKFIYYLLKEKVINENIEVTSVGDNTFMLSKKN